MALTANEILRIRRDIGDARASQVYTDAEIQDDYDRSESVSVEATRQAATRGFLIRGILADSARFNDYTAGATSEKRSQTFDHLKFLYGLYAKAVETVESSAGKSATRVAISNVPRAGRTYPSGWEHDE
jgi:hypothetical protein